MILSHTVGADIVPPETKNHPDGWFLIVISHLHKEVKPSDERV